MQGTDPGLRRVSIHSGATVADLSLPAEIPIAILTPSIVDFLEVRDDDDPTAKRYHLSLPGSSVLDPSKTLAQNNIADGAVLLLSRQPVPPPGARHHDVAEAVAEALTSPPEPGTDALRRLAAQRTGTVAASCSTAIGVLALVRNALSGNPGHEIHTTVGVAAGAGLVALLSAVVVHRAGRNAVAGLALNAMATAFAAVAGFLAVPGAPGVCNVLLAATAATVTCVVAMRASGCGAVTLTAVSCVTTVVAVAALVGVMTAAPPEALGAGAALVSLGLLGAAARVSIVLAGLSPQLSPPSDLDEAEASRACLTAQALRADAWLSSLLAGFSASAAVGAVVTVLAGATRQSCMAFGTITGGLLLLRARSGAGTRVQTFAIAGMSVVGTTFAVAVLGTTGHGPWVAAGAATLSAAALYLGFAAPAMSLSPLARRSFDALEWLALVALVPLACWICGLYDAVRGLNLK
ncbi:type VII secretion integral membrane protein EccD [Mycobacterium sp. E3251]|nr:type VII secretion integral membrane protein EccD [Mycobacterium sp. E3251]OBI24445.1 type VII secretion integral membrane protein EccD [Mycobacterium sp. E2238]